MKKKSAFTLIELILSMVIIGIAFTVLPKILQLASKVSVQNVREEAMYNAVAYIGLIKSTAWDENNTEVDDILHTNSGDYDCNNSTGYRIGGFDGSRNCKNDYNASINLESDNNDLDDMDDFKDANISAENNTNSREYDLNVTVNYVADIAEDDEKFSSTEQSDTSNTKEINVTVIVNKKQSVLGDSLVHMSFTTQNIGQQNINRRSWQ